MKTMLPMFMSHMPVKNRNIRGGGERGKLKIAFIVVYNDALLSNVKRYLCALQAQKKF